MAGKRTDICISGPGFYLISAWTTKGQRFMEDVQGNEGGNAYSDDTRMTQDIADGAVAQGLRVKVNGEAYRG